MIYKFFKLLFFMPFLPIIFIMSILKIFFKIRFVEIDSSRLGHTSQIIEGFFYYCEDFINKKFNFIFFFNEVTANQQINLMIKRKIKVFDSNLFILYLKKAIIFWNFKNLIYDISKYSLQHIFNKENKIFKKKYLAPKLFFTNDEKLKAIEVLRRFGLKKEDKWICIHNRDSLYLKKQFPKLNFDYHNYRDFSVNDLLEAANYFAEKGYYVFRIGKHQTEKIKSKNKKIIDYSFSQNKSDFFDIYLLANCSFYLGSSSGPMNVSISFNKLSYGINFSLPNFSRSHCDNFIIFKRIVNLDSGKFLSLKQILTSDFVSHIQENKIEKYNHKEINNTPEEILLLSNDINREINNNLTLDKDDIKIKNLFWKIYKKYCKNPDINLHNLNISPSFLKKNIDLLN